METEYEILSGFIEQLKQLDNKKLVELNKKNSITLYTSTAIDNIHNSIQLLMWNDREFTYILDDKVYSCTVIKDRMHNINIQE